MIGQISIFDLLPEQGIPAECLCNYITERRVATPVSSEAKRLIPDGSTKSWSITTFLSSDRQSWTGRASRRGLSSATILSKGRSTLVFLLGLDRQQRNKEGDRQ